MCAHALAIDFGTSNSAAAVLENGRPRRIAVEGGADTLPTSVFFPEDGGAMRIGQAAGDALAEGEDGRYMRALKSILGTTLFHQPRLIEGKRRTLAGIVTAFLATMRERAEAATGARYTRILSGRPVHFYTADPDRDARAEADLRACYHDAGFAEVEFLPEPEAAARACLSSARDDGIALIVDIGGGTSDFSLVDIAGGSMRALASHGIRLGGTDFDQRLSVAHVMEHLGLGGQLRRAFGPGLLPVPKAIYHDLATWAKIPFLYARETERLIEDMRRHAVQPDRIARLARVIANRQGHALAFAVEEGKIAANDSEAPAAIGLGFVEPRLQAAITPASMGAALAPFRADLRGAAEQTLALAGVAPEQVGTVVLVGGSSLMRIVQAEMADICPAARLEPSEAFTAVIDGLALALED